MAKLRLPEVRKRVKALAAERPEYVYERPEAGTCYYFHNGAPSCIVGHALADELKAIGVEEGSELNDENIRRLSADLDITPKAVAWLEDVQSMQDALTSWGEAVRVADSRR
jgi:hypothetical protein